MTRDALRPTLAVGYEIAVAVDLEVYRPTTDVNGRAWGFSMDEETREHLADAIETALSQPGGPGPSEVVDLDVSPGYIRLTYEPTTGDTADPADVVGALQDAPDIYNRRHATDPDLDRFALDRRRSYLGSYRPPDSPDREAFLDRRVGGEAVPDTDGPVWTLDRDATRETPLDDARRFAYEFLFPWDADEMYNPGQQRATQATPNLAVEWDHDAVREVLDGVAGKQVLWPGRPANTPRIAIHPGYVAVTHATTDTANPVARAETVRDALLAYNRNRQFDETRSRGAQSVRHPPVAFDGSAYIRALDHGGAADEWIQEQALDAVDGEPDTPADTDDDPDATGDGEGLLSRFV